MLNLTSVLRIKFRAKNPLYTKPPTVDDNDFNSKLRDYDKRNHECSRGENGTILQTTGHRDDRKFNLNSGQIQS